MNSGKPGSNSRAKPQLQHKMHGHNISCYLIDICFILHIKCLPLALARRPSVYRYKQVNRQREGHRASQSNRHEEYFLTEKLLHILIIYRLSKRVKLKVRLLQALLARKEALVTKSNWSRDWGLGFVNGGLVCTTLWIRSQ